MKENKINWELVREMSQKYGHVVPNMRFGEENVIANGTNFAPGVDVAPKWDVPRKVMINTTVTGGFFRKKTNPNQPITPDEIYASLRESCQAGAPMIHVHVRDEDGFNALELDKFHRVIDPLREEFPQVVVDGCVVAYREGYWDRMDQLLSEGLFDTTPINTTASYASDRLFCPYPHHIIEKCEMLLKYNIHPQLAVFTDGDVDNAYRYLISTGLLEKGSYTFCVVPSLPGCFSMASPQGMINSLTSVVHRIREIDDKAHIMVCAGGRASGYVVSLALLMGLDIRVGLEDTIWKWPHKDDLLTSNAETFLDYKKMAELMGREVYTAEELRRELNIRPR